MKRKPFNDPELEKAAQALDQALLARMVPRRQHRPGCPVRNGADVKACTCPAEPRQ